MQDNNNSIEETFGEWTKRPTTWISLLITIIAGATSATQIASTFGNPLLRWSALALISVLCIGGFLLPGKKVQTTILDKNFSPITYSRNRAPAFLLILTGSTVALCADICINIGGYLSPVEFRGPHYSGGITIIYPEQIGERLASIPIRGLSGLMDEGELSEAGAHIGETNPSIGYEFRKSERTKELVIQDATVIVQKFEDEPPSIRSVSPVETSDEIILVFHLSKLNTPLPWKFKPKFLFVNGKKFDWDRGLVRITDTFTNRIKFVMSSNEPGIYHFTAGLQFVSDFSTPYTMAVAKEPVAMLFHGGDRHVVPKEGESIVYLGPGGEMTRDRFKTESDEMEDDTDEDMEVDGKDKEKPTKNNPLDGGDDSPKPGPKNGTKAKHEN